MESAWSSVGPNMQFERKAGSHGNSSWTLQIVSVRRQQQDYSDCVWKETLGHMTGRMDPSLAPGVVRGTACWWVGFRVALRWRGSLVTWFRIASGVDVACLVGLCLACGVVAVLRLTEVAAA